MPHLGKSFDTKLANLDSRLCNVERVQDHVGDIQARLDVLEQNANEKDQWARMNNIEIRGLTEAKNENLFSVLEALGSKINYKTTKEQINFITRIPSHVTDKPKPVIVCFNNRYVKEDFVAATRYLHKQNSRALTSADLGLSGKHNVFVHDHLTPRNKELLNKTKIAAKERNFSYVWVKHAKIYTRKEDTSHVIQIKTEKDLAKIV